MMPLSFAHAAPYRTPTPVHQDPPHRAAAERLGAIRAELLRRLRPVCAGMPQELFVEMIDSMAAIQFKYEQRDTRAL
jgi:hypothetical protein